MFWIVVLMVNFCCTCISVFFQSEKIWIIYFLSLCVFSEGEREEAFLKEIGLDVAVNRIKGMSTMVDVFAKLKVETQNNISNLVCLVYSNICILMNLCSIHIHYCKSTKLRYAFIWESKVINKWFDK